MGGGTWIRVAAPAGKTILAEVFRPAGQGPWPAVVLLHGQGGFSNTFLQTGAEIASHGFLTIVGCWFAGNYDGTSRADPPPLVTNPDGIACPDGPAIKSMASTAAVDDVSALLAVARTLPDSTGRVGLVGNSRGSIASVLTASLTPQSMHAVGAIAGVPPAGAQLIALGVGTPVLLLHGEADEVVSVQSSRNLEAALRSFGKPVQSQYFPGAPHGFFFEAQWHADAMARLVAFLQTTLSS